MAGPVVPIRLLGGAARRALEENGGRGDVLAVFGRSLYVRLGRGALACLGTTALGPGPLNGLCDLPAAADPLDRSIAPGTPVVVEDGKLAIEAHFVFDWAGATTWRPPEAPSGWTMTDLAAGLAELARTPALSAGFGRLISMLNGPASTANVATDPLLRLAWPAVAALRGWLTESLRDASGAGDPPARVAALLGLGPGTTPAGDDLLGGAMLMLRMLGAPTNADCLAGWAVPRAARRTGRISQAHLAAAAAGEGAGGLHDVLVSLATPGAPELRRRLDVLGRIGHSSGWDALTGAALAGVAWLEAAGSRRGRRWSAPLPGESFCPTTAP